MLIGPTSCVRRGLGACMTTKEEQRLLAGVAPWKQLQEGERKAEVQSGDMQGLSWDEDSGSESVAELSAEGQAFEADALDGLADGGSYADGGVHEVRTREVPEDDVPEEYWNPER